MIGRLLSKADFERTLAVTPCSRSAHFVLHYVHACPSPAHKPKTEPVPDKLCTAHAPDVDESVDNPVSGHWLGSVLPKRHARRAVTRNMLRRQMRAAMQRRQSSLRPGLWLLRLRRPFAQTEYASADSLALRAVAAAELDRLLACASC